LGLSLRLDLRSGALCVTLPILTRPILIAFTASAIVILTMGTVSIPITGTITGMPVARITLRAVFITGMLGRPRLWLVSANLRIEAAGLDVITLVVAEFFTFSGFAVTAIAIHVLAGLLHRLLAERHDDAVIVFCVLQIILSQHGITGRLRIARQRHIFLGDVRGGAPYLHVGTVGLKAARQGIVVGLAPAAAAAITIATATPPVLLSLPHGLHSRTSSDD
jgi:hypothetical protein